MTEKQIQSKIDKIISDAERRLALAYKEASDNIKAQLAKMYEKYADNKGVLTYAEMSKYNRLTALEKTIADELTDSWGIIVKDTKKLIADAYGESYYRHAYEINTAIDTNINWGVISKNTIKTLIEEPNASGLSLSELLTDKRYNLLLKERQAMIQGFIQGESYPKMAKRMMGVFDKSFNDLLRIVRTEGTRTANEANNDLINDAQDMGIEIKKIWQAADDDRTRDTHAELDGQIADSEGLFHYQGMTAEYPGGWGVPEMDINCLTGDNYIYSQSKVLKLYKREYKGLIYRIKTSSGIEFSITPNHEILTISGWVKADSLNKGSKILNISLRKKLLRIRPKIYNCPIMFEKVFDFFIIRFSFKRIGGIKEYFHGDVIINSNIDIIIIKSLLLNSIKTFFNKIIIKITFTFSNIAFSPLFSNSTFRQIRKRSFFTFDCIMRRFSLIKSFFWGHLSPFKKFCLTSISPLKSIFFKPSIYGNSCDSINFRKFIDRNSRFMFEDEIVDINISYFSGHVFNLENKDNLYMANSNLKVNNNFAVVHNCRCTVITEVADFKLKKHSEIDKSMSDYDNYQKWQEEQSK